MRYQLLGRSGLRVSEICLGAMTFGHTRWGTSEPEAVRMYRRFRDLGGNFVDTSNEISSEGRSEEIVGHMIAGHRDEVVVATKYTAFTRWAGAIPTRPETSAKACAARWNPA